ncbi:MAG TPA: polysaccharide biosynthesis tyrosine autokinase [Acidimicrobiales bacterium]|nr:polysaccharide biosynthesis tyrosine autokinase [Acidimicrobiales bacterium]
MVPESTKPRLELRDDLRVLRKRKGTVILTVALLVGVTLAVSYLQTPVYEARTEVLLQSRPTESLFDSNTGQVLDPGRVVQTQIRVFLSQPVRDAVKQQLGVTPAVSVDGVADTDVVQVKAESTVAKRAATVADAYANAYIEFRRKQAVDDILAASTQIQAQIDDLQKQIDATEGEVAAAPAAQQSSVRQSVTVRKDALVSQQAVFRQKLDQLQVDQAIKSGGAQLVTPATVPTSPVRPQPLRNAVIALVLGLVLGIGLVFLVEYLDDSVKGKDDLERASGGLPVLGVIPLVEWKDREQPQVISLADPRSPASEAYRTLRTSIQFMALERPVRTMQITSPSPEEGKSTTIANLAVAIARAGQRVVILDCDLRRPRMHEFFGLDRSIGFTSVLLGKVPLSAALQPVPNQSRLSILASGPPPPNPSELLSSVRTVEVLTSLQAEADIVLIDCPPVLPVTDALVVSGRVDATLVVCVAGSTSRKEAARAIELLRQVDAPLVGTVLNGVTADDAYDYGYSYRYYTPDDPGGQRETTRSAKN